MGELLRAARVAGCLAVAAAVTGAAAQSPEGALAALPPEQQAWVNRSCPRALGPSLWASCVLRETRALSTAWPDVSKLSDAERSWVQRSCPQNLGPSLALSCVTREVAAIRSGMPRLDGLPPDKRAWVQQTCPTSLGPMLYRSCAERELRALSAGAAPASPRALVPEAAPRARPPIRSGRRANAYIIETSHDDEIFIINGEKFEAKTYCFNMEEGDEVIFLEGSPLGACASATILNLRTREKCEVWCE